MIEIKAIEKSKTSFEQDVTCQHLTQLLKANTSAILAVQLGSETIIGKVFFLIILNLHNSNYS